MQAQAVAKLAHHFSGAEHLLLLAVYAESSLPSRSTKQALASKTGTDILQVGRHTSDRWTVAHIRRCIIDSSADVHSPSLTGEQLV